MQKEFELAIDPVEIDKEEHLRKRVVDLLKQKKISYKRLSAIQIRKRSIDARSRKVCYRLRVLVFLDEEPADDRVVKQYVNISGRPEVLIIGAGPAGLFAALQCLESGLKPIVIERGKMVKERRRDLALLNKQGLVNPDSNYCFGEGGAGTYSDGKLYTRSDKRGDVRKVLELLVQHGATEDILVNARPHIGTNRLPGIIERVRMTIQDYGGELHFDSRVSDLLEERGKIKGLVLEDGRTLLSEQVILATGHSARDIFYLLRDKGWAIEAKPFALGVRIEHPQVLVDQAQYHTSERPEQLPPAYYSLVQQVEGRGVFSFCMCPGGVIAPCATAEGEVVVNGWSPSKRNNPFANSGTVTEVNLRDVPGSDRDPLALLRFQEEVERKAFEAGGGSLRAPAQRMVDFTEGRLSGSIPDNSYKPGAAPALLEHVLPDFVHRSLQKALPLFGSKMKGYFTNEAVLLGVESRTSSPVRIPRDRETMEHVQIRGLYPCGEGAGYAGGIVSAAIDGMNCVSRIAEKLASKETNL